MKKLKVIDLAIISIFTAIIFVLEQMLSFLPIQLTVILIILYTKLLGFKKSFLIVIIHVILDSITAGSLNLTYFPFMLIGWLIIPISLSTIFKRVEAPIYLALLSIMYSLIYSWLFIIPGVLLMDIKFIPYLIADIPYELLLCGTSFITVLWLYPPLYKLLSQYLSR